MHAPINHADLLERMFKERDLLESEIFRRVYGIEAIEQLAQYEKTKLLPHQVRLFCIESLNR